MFDPKLPPAVARRRLRLRLRQARIEANLIHHEVAERLGWSPSKLIQLENGQLPFEDGDVLALLAAYASAGSEVAELRKLVRMAQVPDLARRYSDVLTPQFAEWIEMEANAASIRQYENQFIPGVLQTDAYAKGIVSGLLRFGANDERAQRIVAARIERAEPLLSPGGPRMEFIIDEAALRRAVGNENGDSGFRSIIAQLNQLKRYNTLGRRARDEIVESTLNADICIQIAPSQMGAYPAMRGPFEILEFREDVLGPMVYFENPDGDEVVKDGDSGIPLYVDLFHDLKARTPSAGETNDYIDLIVEDLKRLR